MLLVGFLEGGVPQGPRRQYPEGERVLGVEGAAKAAGAKDFTEEDVNKRVAEVIAERSKDGAFVFHDPKLNADLNLVYEQIKIVRGMEGYGWFANTIFHDKDTPRSNTPSISGSSPRATS